MAVRSGVHGVMGRADIEGNMTRSKKFARLRLMNAIRYLNRRYSFMVEFESTGMIARLLNGGEL